MYIRITESTFVGGKVWTQGNYNTADLSKYHAEALIKETELQKGLPLSSRTVLDMAEKVEKSAEAVDAVGFNITNTKADNVAENGDDNFVDDNIEDEDKVDSDNVNGDDNEDKVEDDNDSEYLSVEDFAELKATEQKEYINELNEDEELPYDTFYAMLTEFKEVAAGSSVVKLIDDLLADNTEE